MQVREGPHRVTKGKLAEGQFVAELDKLLEVRPGTVPKNTFVFLSSPHRNGNPEFLKRLTESVGRGRQVTKIRVEAPRGDFDPTQYPTIVNALFPELSTSTEAREALRASTGPLPRRLRVLALRQLLPLVLFVIIELLTNALLSPPLPLVGPFSKILKVLLSSVTSQPLWVHLVLLVVALAAGRVPAMRARLLEILGIRDKALPCYRLDERDRRILTGGEKGDFSPIVRRFRGRAPGCTLVVVDSADLLDTFSLAALERCLKVHGESASSWITVLHLGESDSPAYRRFRAHLNDYADPREYMVEAELELLSREEMIEMARRLGKTEADALATTLVDDLVEQANPVEFATQERVKELVAWESPDSRQPSPGTILAVMAVAGRLGPRQFSRAELVQALCQQDSTFARWLRPIRKRPPYPAELDECLHKLHTAYGIPLVHKVVGPDRGHDWVVDGKVRALILEAAHKPDSWQADAHTFWAVYHGERIATGQPIDLDRVADLVWHAARAEVTLNHASDMVPAVRVATGLVEAASKALELLHRLGQFDREYSVFSRLRGRLLDEDCLWADDRFVRAMSRLSSHVWDLAAVRGPSQVFVGFQQRIVSRTTRGGLRGIWASAEIFDAYLKATALKDLDLGELAALTVAGGDRTSRAHLNNVRSYSINLNLFKKYGMTLEGLEVLWSNHPLLGEFVRPQLAKPAKNPGFDLFEGLVRGQCCRALLACGRADEAVEELAHYEDLLSAQKLVLETDDIFRQACWHLGLADARLILILVRLGWWSPPPPPQVVQSLLERLFECGSRDQSFTPETVSCLLDEAAGSLENAEFLNEICRASLGRALYWNTRLRFEILHQRIGRTEPEGLGLTWKKAISSAAEVGATHLANGALLLRASVRTNVEAVWGCLRTLALDALRFDLPIVAWRLSSSLIDAALLLDDTSANDLCVQVIGFVLSSSRLEGRVGPQPLERAHLRLGLVQFLRLLDRPEEAIERLGQLPEEVLNGGRVLDRETRNLALDGLIQRYWCFEALNLNGSERQACLDLALAVPGASEWEGYSHLVRLDLERQLAGKSREPAELAEEAVRRLHQPKPWERVDDRGLLLLFRLTLSLVRFKPRPERCRRVVTGAAKEVARVFGDWTPVAPALGFLREALHFEELDGPSLRRWQQEFVRREAESPRRLAEVDQQLKEGHAQPLLAWAISRFERWIEWIDDAARTTKRLLDQVESSGLQSLDREQILYCASNADAIRLESDRLLVPAAAHMLCLLGGSLPPGSILAIDTALSQKVAEATWQTTRQLLTLVVKGDFVNPQLAKVMETYLRICDKLGP